MFSILTRGKVPISKEQGIRLAKALHCFAYVEVSFDNLASVDFAYQVALRLCFMVTSNEKKKCSLQ